MKKLILSFILFGILYLTGFAQKTWVGSGSVTNGSGTDFNTAANWLPVGVPASTDNVIIAFVNDGNINLSANASIANLTLTLNKNNGQGFFYIGNNTLTVNGTAFIDIINGNPNSALVLGVNLNDATSAGVMNFVGNVSIGPTSGGNNSQGNACILSGNINSIIRFKADVTLGPRAATTAATVSDPGTVYFDGSGTQNITMTNGFVNSYTNVLIGSTNNPTVNLLGTSYCSILGNLTINGSSVLNMGTRPWNRTSLGGTLSIPSIGTLKVGGSANGVLNSNFPANFNVYSLDSTSTVEFNGNAQSVPGAASRVNTYGNLTLTDASLTNTVKTLVGHIGIWRKFTMSASTTLSLDTCTATLISNAITTAYVGAIPSSASITYPSTGRFIVERFISKGRRWQFMSIPTDSTQTVNKAWQEGAASVGSNPVLKYGMQITNGPGTTCAGCDAISPGGHSMKYWNPATGLYVGLPNTTSFLIGSQQAYMTYIRGDRLALSSPTTTTNTTTLRTKGKLYIGGLSPLTTPVPVTATKFTAVGNPFAAPINLMNVTMVNLAGYSGTKGTVYVWDPSLSGLYGIGAFQTMTYDGANYNISPGATSGSTLYANGVWNRIESGQAFFVKGGSSAGSVSFTESAKALGSALVSAPSPFIITKKMRVNLYGFVNGESSLVDGTLTYFHEALSNGPDNMDAEKMINTGENFGLRSAGRILAVDYRSLPGEGDTVFLNMANVRTQHYEMEIAAVNVQANGLTALLEDKYKQTIVPLDLNGVVRAGFDVENIPGSYAADRFRIIFKQEIFPVAITNISAARNPYNTVSVKWNVENEINVATLEIENSEDGIHFSKIGNQPAQNANNISAYSFLHDKASFRANFYRIKSTETTGAIKYSDVAKADAIKGDAEIFSVYPNPIREGKINMLFESRLSGTFNIQVTDIKGQVLLSEKMDLQNSNSVRTITLNTLPPAGTYQVTVSGENIIKTTRTVIVP